MKHQRGSDMEQRKHWAANALMTRCSCGTASVNAGVNIGRKQSRTERIRMIFCQGRQGNLTGHEKSSEQEISSYGLQTLTWKAVLSSMCINYENSLSSDSCSGFQWKLINSVTVLDLHKQAVVVVKYQLYMFHKHQPICNKPVSKKTEIIPLKFDKFLIFSHYDSNINNRISKSSWILDN